MEQLLASCALVPFNMLMQLKEKTAAAATRGDGSEGGRNDNVPGATSALARQAILGAVEASAAAFGKVSGVGSVGGGVHL